MHRVRVHDLGELISTLAAQGLTPVLLDVREPWEIATASLDWPGAPRVDVPMHQVPARLSELDPAGAFLVLCHHGVRSLQVVAFLSEHGYPHTYNIEGGIDAWSLLVDPSVPRY